jgi:hypothetical protein
MDKERHGLVHERKRNEDGGVLPMGATDPETDRALMFPRDPIETREELLKDHP